MPKVPRAASKTSSKTKTTKVSRKSTPVKPGLLGKLKQVVVDSWGSLRQCWLKVIGLTAILFVVIPVFNFLFTKGFELLFGKSFWENAILIVEEKAQVNTSWEILSWGGLGLFAVVLFLAIFYWMQAVLIHQAEIAKPQSLLKTITSPVWKRFSAFFVGFLCATAFIVFPLFIGAATFFLLSIFKVQILEVYHGILLLSFAGAGLQLIRTMLFFPALVTSPKDSGGKIFCRVRSASWKNFWDLLAVFVLVVVVNRFIEESVGYATNHLAEVSHGLEGVLGQVVISVGLISTSVLMFLGIFFSFAFYYHFYKNIPVK